jgi:N-acetyl-alpha-D-muramate 1-phosphate uridylyltransferase
MAPLSVAILAGGLGTRLRPIAERVPKALVEVAGRPFLAWQLDYLRDQGLSKVVLCVGHFGEQIEQFVGDGAVFGINAQFSYDGTVLLGTGGALRRALPLLGEQFFVLYGDSFLPIDYSDVQREYERSDEPGLMTVLRNGNRWDKSNVEFRDGRLLEYNKSQPSSAMEYIDYGLGILDASVLRAYAADERFDLADTYHQLSLEGKLHGYEVYERFYEIGTPAGLREAEAYLTKRRKNE